MMCAGELEGGKDTCQVSWHTSYIKWQNKFLRKTSVAESEQTMLSHFGYSRV
jgi:hypothetical protein